MSCIECKKNIPSSKCFFKKCKPCCVLKNDPLCKFHYKKVSKNKCIECYNKQCLFKKCKRCCTIINDPLCKFHYTPPIPIDSEVLKSTLEELKIFYKDINNLIVDYFDENKKFCSKCWKEDTEFNDIHTYICENCDITICRDCGGENELYIDCKKINCIFCKYGSCCNNKFLTFCSECYVFEEDENIFLNED